MTSEPILIVDDAPANLRLTRLVLAHAGYDVRAAKDAEEALELFRGFHPRMILTDIRLPGMDGLELARLLRTNPSTEDIVILAVTSCALRSDEQKAADAGFDGYIVKPYDTRKLPGIVRQHLSRTGRLASATAEAAVPLPEEMVKQLAGRKLGLIGFDADEASRFSEALSNAHAITQALEGAAAEPDSDTLRSIDLVVFQLHHGASPSEWMKRREPASVEQPILFVGPRNLLLESGISLKSGGHGFLIWPWDPEEAVMRACLALGRAGLRQRTTVASVRPNIVIADDDPTTVALVRAALESSRIECRTASDGGQVLEMVAARAPNAIVLDVNTANLDGFQVLAALKRDEATSSIPVIFLTARQQETDIVRAFGLGVDDYMVKPFSPMELAARLERLVRKVW